MAWASLVPRPGGLLVDEHRLAWTAAMQRKVLDVRDERPAVGHVHRLRPRHTARTGLLASTAARMAAIESRSARASTP